METVLKAISDWIKSLLTAAIMSNLSGLFDDVNTQVGNIAQQVGTKPSSFEPRVFAMIEALSRNGGEPVEEVEQPVLTSTTDEEDVVTVTDEETGALTPEGNLTMVDDYHTSYSDGSGQQFITLVSKSGNTFYLVIDRNDKGENTVHFMNLVDEADLLSLMEDEDADAYTAEKEAAAQAEQERKQAEEDAKKAAEEAAASGSEQTGGNKVTKYAATFLGVLALVGLVAGGGIYTFMKQKQKKQAEKEALDPDANYTEDKGDFEIPVEDEPEETGEEDNAEE